MHSSIIFPGLLAFVLAALPAAAAPAAGEGTSTVTIQGCKPGTVRKTASKMIDGREFAKYECDSIPRALAAPALGTLLARANDLCGAQCPTSCFGSGGNGPNEGDCGVIEGELANAGTIYIGNGQTSYWNYGSCYSELANFSGGDITYCGYDFGGITNYIAGACNAAHGADGGQCPLGDAGSTFLTVGHT